MTYRIYINKDYKPEIRKVSDNSIFCSNNLNHLLVVILCCATGLILGMRSHDATRPAAAQVIHSPLSNYLDSIAATKNIPNEIPLLSQENNIIVETNIINKELPDTSWTTIQVRQGDNLALIFNRF